MLVGPAGLNITCTVSDEPLSICTLDGLILISPTGVVIYTTQVAFFITPLIFCETVTCAIPGATPFISNNLPSSDCLTSISVSVGTTPAASGWLVTVYVISFLSGELVTSASRVFVSPMLTLIDVRLIPKPSITVISYVIWFFCLYTVDNSSSTLCAIIVACPAPVAVTSPVV